MDTLNEYPLSLTVPIVAFFLNQIQGENGFFRDLSSAPMMKQSLSAVNPIHCAQQAYLRMISIYIMFGEMQCTFHLVVHHARA